MVAAGAAAGFQSGPIRGDVRSAQKGRASDLERNSGRGLPVSFESGRGLPQSKGDGRTLSATSCATAKAKSRPPSGPHALLHRHQLQPRRRQGTLRRTRVRPRCGTLRYPAARQAPCHRPNRRRQSIERRDGQPRADRQHVGTSQNRTVCLENRRGSLGMPVKAAADRFERVTVADAMCSGETRLLPPFGGHRLLESAA